MQMGIVTMLAFVGVVFSIIELGLTGYMADLYNGWTPDRIGFMVFCSVWSLVVLAYLIVTPQYLPQFYHKVVSLALNAVTMIFWFAGSIAIAVMFSGCDGCGVGKAAIVFGFFLWIIFTVMTVLDALDFRKNRSTSSMGPKGPQVYVGA